MSTTQRSVLILGGTSDIARAIALAFAKQQWTVRLAGRSRPALQREADDIAIRSGRDMSVHLFNALETHSFAELIDSLPALPDVVISIVGLLGEQRRAEVDLDHAADIMRANYEGPALILSLIANRF